MKDGKETHKISTASREKNDPLVSINIPTYNSGKTLNSCLRSIANQTHRNIEIIIIDSYSHDQTLEIARNHSARIYFAETLSEARKAGAEKSLGKYILFVDSDQVLAPYTIKKCVDECEKNRCDAITLFERSIVKKGTFTERVIAYDKWLFHSQHDDHPVHGSAIPRFFRAKVLKRIKWPERLGALEHNLIYYEVAKKGAKVIFLDVSIYHREPSSLTEFVSKFYRYGFHYIPALSKNKKFVLSHSMPRRVYFTRKALEKPTLFAGLILLYMTKALATLTGVFSYLAQKVVYSPNTIVEGKSLRKKHRSPIEKAERLRTREFFDAIVKKKFRKKHSIARTHIQKLFRKHKAVVEDLLVKSLSSSRTIVDVGCGNGHYAILLSKRIRADVVAFDISSESLKKAKERKMHQQAANVHLVVADAEHTPFRNWFFDAATSIDVIHHLGSFDILKKLKAQLKAGGTLFLSEPTKDNPLVMLLRMIFPYLPKSLIYPVGQEMGDMHTQKDMPETFLFHANELKYWLSFYGYRVITEDRAVLFAFFLNYLRFIPGVSMLITRSTISALDKIETSLKDSFLKRFCSSVTCVCDV